MDDRVFRADVVGRISAIEAILCNIASAIISTTGHADQIGEIADEHIARQAAEPILNYGVVDPDFDANLRRFMLEHLQRLYDEIEGNLRKGPGPRPE